jgi:plastocyanin
MKRATIIALLGIALGVAVLVPAASGSGTARTPKPVVKTVHIGDDFYAPIKVTIKRGQRVHWIWNKTNFDSHNVTLIQGPKGVNPRKFTSATGSSGVRFERQFLTPGTYHFECTVHLSMNMTVIVKR